MLEKVVNKPVLGVKPVRRPSTTSSMQKPVVSSRKASATRKMLGVDSLHPKNITATVTKVNQTAKNVTRIFKTPVPSKFTTNFDSKSKRSISSTTSSGKKPFRQNVKSSPSVRKRESGLSSSSAKPVKPRIQSSKNEIHNKTQPIKKESNQAQNKATKIVPKSAPKRQTSAVKHSANVTITKKVETAPKSSQPKVQSSSKTNKTDKVMKVEKPNKIEKMNEIDNKIKIDFSKIKEIEPDVFNDGQSKIPKFDPTKIKSADLLKNKSGLDIGLNVFQSPESKSSDKKEIIDIKPPPSSIPVLEKRIAETKISVNKKPESLPEQITPPVKKIEPVKPAIKKIQPVKKTSTESKKSDKSDTKKPKKLQTKKPSLKTITETLIDNEKLKEAVRIAKEQSNKAAAEIREKRRSNILKLIEKKKLEMRAKKKEKEQEERLITASPITTE